MKHIVLLLAMLAVSSNSDGAELIAPDEPEGDLKIMGGEPQSPQNWPATLIFETKTGGCTATAVGAQAILTAAHCINDNEEATLKTATSSVKLSCERHPRYALADSSLDFALCFAAQKLKGFAFENIGTSIAHPRKGQNVKLLGFGCTKEGGFDKSFGVLYLGDARVVRRPPGKDNYTVTAGAGAVCYGDSGGAAYYYSSSTGRVVFAVNSKGDISEYSFLSSTFINDFTDWAIEWTEAKNVPICGLSPEATGCRPL